MERPNSKEYIGKKMSLQLKLIADLDAYIDYLEQFKVLTFINTCPQCFEEDSLHIRFNQRADASFKYYIDCIKCNTWVGRITWENEIKINKPTKE